MICSNPSCRTDNPPSLSSCRECGSLLGENPTGASPAGRGPAKAPAPNVKRRTVYEPGPEEQPPAPHQVFAGLSARTPIDPSNPFGAPAQWGGAPRVSEAPPAYGQAQPSAGQRPKAKTIISSGQDLSVQVEGALFVYANPTDPGSVHPLRSGRNRIGRGDDCEVVLQDGSVSLQHAFIMLKPDATTFMDISQNGSIVDGKPVIGDTAVLADSAVIRVGETVLVFVRIGKETLDAIYKATGFDPDKL